MWMIKLEIEADTVTGKDYMYLDTYENEEVAEKMLEYYKAHQRFFNGEFSIVKRV